jgi:predicted RNase H-like HicB family nuclease
MVLEREPDGGFHVSCPALPGCHTQGDNLDEAVANAREALSLYIESLIAHNEPLPMDEFVKLL